MSEIKLVRDKIPEIIKKKGGEPVTSIADKKTFRNLLIKKIIEEAEELIPNKSKEEIADVLEATYSLIKFEGFSLEEIERIRKEKAKERGTFEKGIILKRVE